MAAPPGDNESKLQVNLNTLQSELAKWEHHEKFSAPKNLPEPVPVRATAAERLFEAISRRSSEKVVGGQIRWKPVDKSAAMLLTLGSRSTGTNFSGYILAVLVYDRALTETEANTIRQYLIDTYAVTVPYPPPPLTLHDGLVAYWAMDSVYNPEPDLSGHGIDLYADASPKVAGFMGAAYDAGGDTGGWAPGMTSFGYPLDGAGDYSFSLWVSGNMPTAPLAKVKRWSCSFNVMPRRAFG